MVALGTQRKDAKAQRRKDCPQITQIHRIRFTEYAEIQRLPEKFHRPARSRPPTAAGHRWSELPLRTPAFVAAVRPSGLRSRRAKASPLTLFMGGMGLGRSRSSRHCRGGTDAPLVRRPGERPTVTDAGIRNWRALQRQPAIVRSPAFPPALQATSSTQATSLCAFVFSSGPGSASSA